MQAIQTRYKGHRFRSRLEARWAAFFDAAGIHWQYEPEGYVLADGRSYLPDFYLPELEVHIEIKPAQEHFAEAEALRLCGAFRHPHAPLVVFYGLPGQSFGLSELTAVDGDGGGQLVYDLVWCGYEEDGRIGLTCRQQNDIDRTIFQGYDEFTEPHRTLNRQGDPSDARLTAMFDAAASFRAEFGESGAG